MDDAQKAERRAQLRRMQSDLFVLESDRGRLARKHEEALIEVKRIKNSIAHLEADQTEKIRVAAALERDVTMMDDEIGHHKKKMNAL